MLVSELVGNSRTSGNPYRSVKVFSKFSDLFRDDFEGVLTAMIEVVIGKSTLIERLVVLDYIDDRELSGIDGFDRGRRSTGVDVVRNPFMASGESEDTGELEVEFEFDVGHR